MNTTTISADTPPEKVPGRSSSLENTLQNQMLSLKNDVSKG